MCLPESKRRVVSVPFFLEVHTLQFVIHWSHGYFSWTSPQSWLKDSELFLLSCRNPKVALQVVGGRLHSLQASEHGCGRATENSEQELTATISFSHRNLGSYDISYMSVTWDPPRPLILHIQNGLHNSAHSIEWFIKPPQVNGALGEGVSAPSKGPTPAGAVMRREVCWALDYNHHPLVVVLGIDSGCVMQVLNH